MTGIHPDGSLTVTRQGGHGTVTLPADYVHEHVRLGYAATEHGHQGDTVDIGIALVSSATTHRGLYVAMTRGRDDNQLHVITDTVDLDNARNVLDGVVAHDRADVPAVTQRRILAETPPPVPRRGAVSSLPEWVGPWREQLEHQRDDLVRYFVERDERRQELTQQITELEPALQAARDAWQPYAEPIAELDDQVRRVLRPAVWRANEEARRAGARTSPRCWTPSQRSRPGRHPSRSRHRGHRHRRRPHQDPPRRPRNRSPPTAPKGPP